MTKISSTLELRFLYPEVALFLLREGSNEPFWYHITEPHLYGEYLLMHAWGDDHAGV